MDTIESLTAEELSADENWLRVYGDSFPPSEREPAAVILKSLRLRVGMAFRLRSQNVTLGLATTHLLKDPAAVFLVYLAIARDQRSRGAGGRLLEWSWEASSKRLADEGLHPLGLVWEVDPPEAESDDAEARRRRVGFFQRHGGRLLDRPYVQPPVDGIRIVPMSLMFRGAGNADAPAGETLEALVRAIYFEKYGAMNGIDSTMLEDLLRRR